MVAALDELVEDLAAFGLTRSEIVNVILKDYLRSNADYKSKTMELMARARIERP